VSTSDVEAPTNFLRLLGWQPSHQNKNKRKQQQQQEQQI